MDFFVSVFSKRRIQDPFKYLSGNFLAKIINGFKPLSIFAKSTIIDIFPYSDLIRENTENENIITRTLSMILAEIEINFNFVKVKTSQLR